nr:MAG TPA: hypothetical protein [Caudoviricetes sp.]
MIIVQRFLFHYPGTKNAKIFRDVPHKYIDPLGV